MIEKLKVQDDSSYPYLDEDGCSHSSKTNYLMGSVLNFCGCGDPTSAMVFIKDVLEIIESGDSYLKLPILIPVEGARYFVLYVLDEKEFTEHGSSVGGCWLTDTGKELLNDIRWCLENEKDEEEEG